MRGCLTRTCALALSLAAPVAAHAQRIATEVASTSALELRLANLGSLETATIKAERGMHHLLLPTRTAPPAVAQADSAIASDSHAQTGAIMGGLLGALGGGLAFAHFTHRAGGTNTTTGTLGGAVVGAGLIGTLGALAGLVIGSAVIKE
jgi:hypothetical protein